MALRKTNTSAIVVASSRMMTTRPPARQSSASMIPKTSENEVAVGVGPRMRVRKPTVGAKKPRKTRVIHDFTYEELAQYFHLSQREAGTRLGVSAITMKRNCKRRGIRWPFRTKKIEAARKARCGSVTSLDDDDGQEDSDCCADACQPPGAQSSSDHSTANAESSSEDDEEHLRSAHSSQSPVNQSNSEFPMSEAAIVFARLPYLCVQENQH